MRIPIVLVAAASVLAAQEQPTNRNYLDRVRDLAAAPASALEMRGAILLKLAALPLPAELRKEFFTTAFELSSSASQPVPLQYRGLATDTRDANLSEYSKAGLDRLTLQTSAVQGLIAKDPATARELFASISLPPGRHIRCSEDITPDTTAYFQTGALFLARAIDPQDLKKGLHLGLASQIYSRLNDVHAIAGAVESLSALPPDPELRSLALNTLLHRAEELRPSERDIQLLMANQRLQQALANAALTYKETPFDRQTMGRLFASIAKAAHYQAPCGVKPKKAVSPRDQYIMLMELLGLESSIETWPEQLTTPVALVAIPPSPNVQAWRKGEGLEMLTAVQELNPGEDTPEREWKLRLGDVHQRVSNWKPGDNADPLEFAENQFRLLYRLIVLQPEGPVAASWTRDLITRINAHAAVLPDHPAYKVLCIRRVLDLLRDPPSGAGADRERIQPGERKGRVDPSKPGALRAAVLAAADSDFRAYLELRELTANTPNATASRQP